MGRLGAARAGRLRSDSEPPKRHRAQNERAKREGQYRYGRNEHGGHTRRGQRSSKLPGPCRRANTFAARVSQHEAVRATAEEGLCKRCASFVPGAGHRGRDGEAEPPAPGCRQPGHGAPPLRAGSFFRCAGSAVRSDRRIQLCSVNRRPGQNDPAGRRQSTGAGHAPREAGSGARSGTRSGARFGIGSDAVFDARPGTRLPLGRMHVTAFALPDP